MQNEITVAPAVAPGQEQTASITTSGELEIQLQELRARRAEMATETEKARVDLAEKRAAIRFLRPKSVEEATIAQARFTVLTDAGAALEEEIESLEGALQTALAKEQRVRDLEELQQLRAQLDDEKEQLKMKSLDAATDLQTALDAINEGQQRVATLTHQIQWKREKAGAGAGDVAYGFADGHLSAHLSESGQVETVIVQEFITAARRLRQSRHIAEHGITIYNDAPMNYGDGAVHSDVSGILPSSAQDVTAPLASALKGLNP